MSRETNTAKRVWEALNGEETDEAIRPTPTEYTHRAVAALRRAAEDMVLPYEDLCAENETLRAKIACFVVSDRDRKLVAMPKVVKALEKILQRGPYCFPNLKEREDAYAALVRWEEESHE